MADLWSEKRRRAMAAVEPLAVRMRPRELGEVAGQRHILGEGKLLTRMIAADRLTSLIFHGPPGTGKTTLAQVIARATDRHFEQENASSVGVARIREIIEQAKSRLMDSGRKTILFLDEIHRFSKSQQDVLLGDVERGVITLIGATTENPLFAVNSALVSRSTLFRLEPVGVEDVVEVLKRAIGDKERGYGGLELRIDEEALRVWGVKCDGDVRRALTALEVAVVSGGRDRGKRDQESNGAGEEGMREGGSKAQGSARRGSGVLHITREVAEESIQQKAAVYDGTGDEHYDAISAMIKSVRGSDPDAAVYWIARMLEAGEDPRFIARRLAVLASEDIGNADPRGVLVAAACWELVERLGMPECRITLSQCACYLALAPKSNASYMAIEGAMEDVRQGRTVAVPTHIKDTNVKKAARKSVGDVHKQGAEYEYAHTQGIKTSPGGVGMVGAQDYLGVKKAYYEPTEHGYEKTMKERLEEVKKLRGGKKREGEK